MEVAALNAAVMGDLDRARAQLAALRERAGEIGDRPGVGRADVSLSDICRRTGDLDASLDYAAEAVELFGELGNHYGLGVALGNSGDLALRRSNLLTPRPSSARRAPSSVELTQSIWSSGGACPASRRPVSAATRTSRRYS